MSDVRARSPAFNGRKGGVLLLDLGPKVVIGRTAREKGDDQTVSFSYFFIFRFQALLPYLIARKIL